MGRLRNQYSYTSAAAEHKRRFVARFLEESKPAPITVWDVAANTGEYSRLAAGRGISTIAFDIDPAAVERNQSRLDPARGDEHPAAPDRRPRPESVAGLARPRADVLFSSAGPADACLALALIHHMAVSGNVPLGQAAEFFHKIGRKLVIEFVPKSDSQFRRMMQARDDVFYDYSQASFESAFLTFFTIDRAEQVAESERTLYEDDGEENDSVEGFRDSSPVLDLGPGVTFPASDGGWRCLTFSTGPGAFPLRPSPCPSPGGRGWPKAG